jgi:hypothetical protein
MIKGGPWRHKGDALIVVHYDGLVRPSKVRIQSIGLWIWLYDMPPAMMKPSVAGLLGRQIGKFVKVDCRYLCYLRVQVEFPLSKPLMLELTVKVKGRGQMLIVL